MKTMFRDRISWILAGSALLAVVPLLQRCGGSSTAGLNGRLTVSNQILDFTGQSVVVSLADLVGDGFLVITADSGNAPDSATQLGASGVLAAGTHNNQAVSLGTDATDGQKLWAVILEDDGNNTLDYPGADTVKVQRSFTVNLPSVTASNQTLALTTLVTVAQVRSVDGGWLVIHDAAGGAGNILGHAALAVGTQTNQTVELDAPTGNATLYAIIHTDAGTIGLYEPGTDDPLLDPGIIEDTFDATVAAGTPEMRINVVNSGTTAYSWTSVVPSWAEAGLFAGGMGMDSAITFTLGDRYEIVNGGGSSHPFELVGAADSVKLSQSVAGSLEADVTIDWVEINATTFRFTASASLQAVLTNYRCAIHTAAMRGSASIP